MRFSSELVTFDLVDYTLIAQLLQVRQGFLSSLLESGANLSIGSAIASHVDPHNQALRLPERGRPKTRR